MFWVVGSPLMTKPPLKGLKRMLGVLPNAAASDVGVNAIACHRCKPVQKIRVLLAGRFIDTGEEIKIYDE